MFQYRRRAFRTSEAAPVSVAVPSESAGADGKGRPSPSTSDPLGIYLAQMGRIPRLSREGEVEVSRRIDAARRNYRSKILESPLGALEAIRVLENIRDTHGPREQTLEDTSSIDPDQPGILGRLPSLITSLRSRVAKAYRLHRQALHAGLSTESRIHLISQARAHQREWLFLLEELHFHPKKLRPCVEQLETLVRSMERPEGSGRDGRSGRGAPSADSRSELLSRTTLLAMEGPSELRTRVDEIHSLRGEYEQAKQILCAANLRLVVLLAARYKNVGLPLADLIQEGNIALMRAAEKFRHHKGSKFSTYSAWWIQQGISRAINDQVRPIRLPINVQDAIRAYQASAQDIVRRFGREPSPAERIRCSSLPFEETLRLLRISRQAVSLDSPLRQGSGGGLRDLIEDEEMPDPGLAAQRRDMREHIARKLNRLPSRERDIIKLRFGIGKGRPSTLEEIGNRFNLSRERVRQIEEAVIEKLRQPSWFQDPELYLEAVGR